MKKILFRDVQSELQRARSVRRYLPWVLTTALGVAALAGVAARSWSAVAGMFIPGAAFGLYVLTLATPRCPACGSSLWKRDERPGPASAPRPTEVEQTHRCPGCGVAFD